MRTKKAIPAANTLHGIFLRNFVLLKKESGKSPSLSEMAKALGYRSGSRVWAIAEAMVKQGLLIKINGKKRPYEVADWLSKRMAA